MNTMRAMAAVMGLALMAGCDKWDFGSSAPPEPAAAKPTTTVAPPSVSPATQPARTVAILVNDRPIYLDSITDLLLHNSGLSVAQHLVASELTDQLAAQEHVTVSDKEIEEQSAQAVKEMFPEVVEPEQRQRVLNQYLAGRNFSLRQWDVVMRRNALLAKIAARRVKVTDEDLHNEFGNQYGRRVIVRHIQVATLADAQKVLAELKQKPDFEAAARKYSISDSAAQGGLLPEISDATPGLPPALRQTALALRKPGEISDPVSAGSTFHILKLEKLLEPQNVKFEEVRAKLAEAVYRKQLRQIQGRLLSDMIRTARIDYINPVLKAQAEKLPAAR